VAKSDPAVVSARIITPALAAGIGIGKGGQQRGDRTITGHRIIGEIELVRSAADAGSATG